MFVSKFSKEGTALVAKLLASVFWIELCPRNVSAKLKSSDRRTRAQRDSEAVDHQIESFSGTESGTELLKQGGENVVKSIEMIW